MQCEVTAPSAMSSVPPHLPPGLFVVLLALLASSTAAQVLGASRNTATTTAGPRLRAAPRPRLAPTPTPTPVQAAVVVAAAAAVAAADDAAAASATTDGPDDTTTTTTSSGPTLFTATPRPPDPRVLASAADAGAGVEERHEAARPRERMAPLPRGSVVTDLTGPDDGRGSASAQLILNDLPARTLAESPSRLLTATR